MFIFSYLHFMPHTYPIMVFNFAALILHLHLCALHINLDTVPSTTSVILSYFIYTYELHILLYTVVIFFNVMSSMSFKNIYSSVSRCNYCNLTCGDPSFAPEVPNHLMVRIWNIVDNFSVIIASLDSIEILIFSITKKQRKNIFPLFEINKTDVSIFSMHTQ